jgi:branched-chain amino acid transport system ATP-binding protein
MKQKEKKISKISILNIAPIVFVCAALFPLIDKNTYHLHVLTLVFIYIALSLGLNLLTGHAGIVDLGYIAFYAIGAYTYTLLSQTVGLPFLAQIPILAIVALMIGIILGLPALRVRGDYLAVVTLGFGEIVRLIAVNWYSVTNGAIGIKNIPQPWIGLTIKTPFGYYLFALVILAIVAWLAHRLVVSGIGWAWCTIRTSEDLGKALGHNVVSLKLLAFCIGAVIAVICGAFFASFQSFISPESFILFESIMILSMVILGGGIGGNLTGVVIAAFILTLLPEAFRALQDYRLPIYGIVMAILVMRREHGLIWFNWLNYAVPHKIRENPDTESKITSTHPEEKKKLVGIEVDSVVCRFGGVRALDGISYKFEGGHTFGIIGHNGAGKTTLINVISGVYRMTSGNIKSLVDGKNTGGSVSAPGSGLTSRLVSRTFQKVILIPDLDAFQNVFLACYPSGVKNILKELGFALLPTNKQHRLNQYALKVKKALQQVSFPEDMMYVQASELPFGLKRKVELARALVMDAPIMLLDEPLSGLSKAEREELYSLLQMIAATKEKTIILVEHQIQYMENLCDNIIYMESGNICIDENKKPIIGNFRDVYSHPHVQNSYFGFKPVPEGAVSEVVKKKLEEQTILKVKGLNVSYPNRGQVIYDAEVDVFKNTIVLISGLNGSGKTTILKSIIGLGGTIVDSGNVAFNDNSVLKLPANKRALMGIFYVPQENRIFDSLTVKEHFALSAGGDKKFDPESSLIIKKWFPILKDKWNISARSLSGGQQQMLVLALSFARLENCQSEKPSLLIMDEPTTGLQPSLQQITYDILKHYCANYNVGVLLTEQKPEAASVADFHYKLEAGHMKTA